MAEEGDLDDIDADAALDSTVEELRGDDVVVIVWDDDDGLEDAEEEELFKDLHDLGEVKDGRLQLEELDGGPPEFGVDTDELGSLAHPDTLTFDVLL